VRLSRVDKVKTNTDRRRPATPNANAKHDQIRELMQMLGITVPVSLKEAQAIVADVDMDGSGALDFEEFLQVGQGSHSGCFVLHCTGLHYTWSTNAAPRPSHHPP